MVSQCFDSLNIYGKEPEQLENMILMFTHAFQEYEIHEIKRAFVDWVKTNAEMPTPAGIIEIIHSNRPKAPIKYDHSQPWEYEAAAEAKRNPKRVQWFGKMWENFSDDDKKKLAVHMASMTKEKASNYALYLKNFAKAPGNLFDVLKISFEDK
jgi:hypothetical protein